MICLFYGKWLIWKLFFWKWLLISIKIMNLIKNIFTVNNKVYFNNTIDMFQEKFFLKANVAQCPGKFHNSKNVEEEPT